MGLYSDHIMPRVTHFCCSLSAATEERLKVVPLAKGTVVEVGVGSGLNLPHYDRGKVKKLIGINPPDGFARLLRLDRDGAGLDVEVLLESAESMSLESGTADDVVTTFTLCSIAQVEAALVEIRRILKPGGRLLFVEHGRADDERTQARQDWLTPYWRRFTLGCHLNRDHEALIGAAGFSFERLDRYVLGERFRFAGYHYCGIARPA